MYGSLSRIHAQNHKARLADSYNQLLRQINSKEVKTIGNYTVSKLIGEGSFGKVYLGQHKFTHSKVVLKSAPKDQPQLVREIHHHRLFKHPHIARLYEVIVTEQYVWLVLEYCAGDELYNHLVKNTRLKRDETRKMFSQLVGAVAYTHSKNCAHRDLKLENVMLDKKLNVKLCDFGFTREYEPRTLLDTVCGTTTYMAPEMLMNKRYNGELVDVWSLGVILYTMMYGEQPFDEDTDLDTKMKIISEEPRYPPHGDISGLGIELVQLMLEKDPKTRPTLEEILQHPFLDDFGTSQLEILNQKKPKLFASKAEKRVLRNLRAAHVDLEQLADSVLTFSCDPLAGFWALALEKEEKLQHKRGRRASLSISRYSHHRQKAASGTGTGAAWISVPTSPNQPSAAANEPPQQPPVGGEPQLAEVTPQRTSPSAKSKSSMTTVLTRTNERGKVIGNSFKNMIKMMIPGIKRGGGPGANPQVVDLAAKNGSSSTIAAPVPKPSRIIGEEEGGSGVSDSSNQQLGLGTGTTQTSTFTLNNRPVSGISQYSQFSQYSLASSAASNTSQDPQQPRRRPTFGRRSTSSSFSSLVSRTRRRNNHAKTSSTSSTSLNNSPVGRRDDGDSPRASRRGGATSFGQGRKFNETATFSGHRVRHIRKSPFSSPRGSMSLGNRTPITNKKGSVIQEDEEMEMKQSDTEEEDEDEVNLQRGRSM